MPCLKGWLRDAVVSAMTFALERIIQWTQLRRLSFNISILTVLPKLDAVNLLEFGVCNFPETQHVKFVRETSFLG